MTPSRSAEGTNPTGHRAAERGFAIGIDVGTSGIKAVAVDAGGSVRAEAERSYPLSTPQPGWTEQQPEDWWRAACGALRELSERMNGEAPAALGLTGQMHGMVPLDDDGAPVRPAILWNDQRTGAAVQEIDAAVGRATLIARGGNPAITGFQLPKLVWMRRAEPEAFGRVRTVLFPKDYLGFRLTGRAVAEPADASGSNAFLLAEKAWDTEVLAAVGIDPGLYPEVVASDAVVGGLTSAAAAATGISSGTPVVAGAGDNAAAATGLGLSSARPELGSLSLGTSGVLLAPTGAATPDPAGRVHLFCHADGGYYLLGVTLAAAGALQWLRDTLFADTAFGDLADLARNAPVGSRGVTFLPYLAGERTPYMDPDLRGSWRGLSLAATRDDLVRSVLEGVAFSQRDSLEVMRPLASLGRLLATGGGSRSSFWLQLVSDALELPLTRLSGSPGAAYGAALLGWRGAGVTVDPSLQDIERIEPAPTAELSAAYRAYREAAPPL